MARLIKVILSPYCTKLAWSFRASFGGLVGSVQLGSHKQGFCSTQCILVGVLVGWSACVMINVHFKIQDAFKCWWDKGVFRRMERGVHYSLMLDL
eukprot:scaffold213865_cov18-Tisochrysis_lutea.AAC.1